MSDVMLYGFKIILEADRVGKLVYRVREKLNDNELFEKLFIPLTIQRVQRDNVNPTGTSMWYARNDGGHTVVLGNKVFFNGRQNVKAVYGAPYSTDDLIMHEICHNINYRVNIEPFYRYYADRSLFSFVSASSKHPAETITDAFANYFMGVLKDVWFMERVLIPYIKSNG